MSANSEGLYGLTIGYIMRDLGFLVLIDSLTDKVFVIDYGKSFSLILEGKYHESSKQFLCDFYKLSYDRYAKSSKVLKVYCEQETFTNALLKVTNLLLFFMEQGILPDNKKVRRTVKKYSNRARW